MTDGALEPLWRHLLGHRMRQLRLANGEKLSETAARAGISPQYLSEIERGLKEPSSEMIAAIAGALGITLLDLAAQVVDELRSSGDPLGAGSVRQLRSIPAHPLAHPASHGDAGRVLALAA